MRARFFQECNETMLNPKLKDAYYECHMKPTISLMDIKEHAMAQFIDLYHYED